MGTGGAGGIAGARGTAGGGGKMAGGGGGKAGGAGGVATLQGGGRISRGLSLKGNQACDMLQLAIMDHPTCAKTWHGMV